MMTTKLRVSSYIGFLTLCGLLGGMDVYAGGPLRVSANGRYFTDDTGKAIYLTGSHTWNNFLDGGWAAEYWTNPYDFQYETYLQWMEDHGHNFIRLWTPENTRDFEACSPAGQGTCPESGFRAVGNAVNPTLYERVTCNEPSCYGADGLKKFELHSFKEAYFTRLQERIEQAAAHDPTIYVSIMLFDAWGAGVYAYSQGFFPNASPQVWWRGHPYNILNNINGIHGGDSTTNGSGTGIYSQSFVVNGYNDAYQLQLDYVREVVQRTQNYDNVLYEVANEARGDISPDWQNAMVNAIRKAEGEGQQHPIGVTAMYGGSTLALRASGADWISPQFPDDPNSDYDYVTNPPPADGTQVIILDTDHLGANLGRAWVWKSFTRGHNPIYMDQLDDPLLGIGGATQHIPPFTDPDIAEDARLAMGATKYYANKVNLIDMTPQPELSSTTYVLAKVGEEYLVYQPVHGEFTVSVLANRYAVEWFNPETRGCEWEGDRTVIIDADEIFTPPMGFQHDAVLYLTIYEREKIDHLPLQ